MSASTTVWNEQEFLKQEFTSNGSFTVPAGVTRLIVYGSGGGGNGSGPTVNGGGGAGGYGCLIQNAILDVTPGQVLSVALGGAQASSTFGPLTFASIPQTSGGAATTSSGLAGNAGAASLYSAGGAAGGIASGIASGGSGGGSSWGIGGTGGAGNGGSLGGTGGTGGYGAGGGGGGGGTPNGSGGSGGPGKIVVLYTKRTVRY